MEMRLKPSEIRFSQDSIASSFDKRSQHSYKAIGETLDDLLTGKCSIEDIPTITVQSRNGEWYTADNRRLWVFKRLEERKKCETIPVHTGWINPKKFTTYNRGMSIRIRGDAGGTHWLRSCSSQVIRERSTKEPASYIVHSISNKSKYSETVNKPKFSICELSEEFASQAVLRDRYPMSARKLTRDLSDQGNRDKLFVTRSAFGNENYSGKHISLNPTSREYQLTNCQIPRSVPVRELQSTDMNSSEHISLPLRKRQKTDMNSTIPRSVSIRGRQTTGLILTTPRSVLEKGQTTHRNLVMPFNVSRSPIQKETRGEFISTTVVNSDTMLRLKPSDIKYPSPCISCQFRASKLGDVLDYIITDKLSTSMLEPLSAISLPVGYVACDPSALWILKKAERFGKCHSIKVSVVKRHLPENLVTDIVNFYHSSGPGGKIWKEKMASMVTLYRTYLKVSDISCTTTNVIPIHCNLLSELEKKKILSKSHPVISYEGKCYSLNNKHLLMLKEYSKRQKNDMRILVSIKDNLDNGLFRYIFSEDTIVQPTSSSGIKPRDNMDYLFFFAD